MSKTLVFDFDGTLAQTLQVIIKGYNLTAKQYGFTEIDDNYLNLEQIRSKNVHELLTLSNVKKIQIPFIAKKIRDLVKSKLNIIPPVRNIQQTLVKLQSNQISMGILTSNDQTSVEEYLQIHQLEFFNFIYSETNIFGKARAMRRMLKNEALENDEVIYIGDETRDVEACQKVGIEMIGVTWGFNNEAALKKASCKWLAYEPGDLLELVKVVK